MFMKGEHLGKHCPGAVVRDHKVGQPALFGIVHLVLHPLEDQTAIDPVSFDNPVDGCFFWTGNIDHEVVLFTETAFEQNSRFLNYIRIAAVPGDPLPEILLNAGMEDRVQGAKGCRVTENDSSQGFPVNRSPCKNTRSETVDDLAGYIRVSEQFLGFIVGMIYRDSECGKDMRDCAFTAADISRKADPERRFHRDFLLDWRSNSKKSVSGKAMNTSLGKLDEETISLPMRLVSIYP